MGLAFHVRRSQPTLGLIGGALAVAGAIGLGAGFAIDGFTWGTLGAISTERRVDSGSVAVRAAHRPVLALADPLLRAHRPVDRGRRRARDRRARTPPIWAAGLLGLGGLLVGIEGRGRRELVLRRVVAGAVRRRRAVAFVISRMDDRAFAGA